MTQPPAEQEHRLHPHILVSAQPGAAAVHVDRLRQATGNGGPRQRLWEQVYAVAQQARQAAPITPFDALPGRSPADIGKGNRDYRVVDAAGQRVICAALAALITQDASFAQAALRQMECLFDTSVWEEWQDIFHRERFDLDADLRTGQLSRDLALAWDWMHGLLTDDERQWVVDGIDRCGVQPYLRAVDAGAWWVSRMNNWTTVIVGGLGMCGMALAEAHADSRHLVDMARPLMTDYMGHYGRDGEFNENPSYANSSFLPALFFSCLRSHDGDPDVPVPIAALHRHAYWTLYATAPPGHLVSFGDGGPGYPALTSFVPAVASATQDEILQWFYLQYGDPASFPVWELLWFDSELAARAPTPQQLPLGRAYDEHSGLISSRTGWEPDSTASVVFGKAGHGGVNHSHPDGGQIEIQALGTPLIVDLGAVPYPADNARQYYHFSSDGHNQLTIGGRAQAWVPDGSRRAHRRAAEFDNDRGAWWRIDLTELHDGVDNVQRTVIHLFPGIVVVVDEALLHECERSRLRWHPASNPQLDDPGQFCAVRDNARVDAWVGFADGTPADLVPGRHQYRPPYDHDRIGNPMPQRREPYVDVFVEETVVRLVSLFCVGQADVASPWSSEGDRWTCRGGQVTLTDDTVSVVGEGLSWMVPLS